MWISAFILGIAGGFHCVGMCGPIALMLPLDRSNGARRAVQLGNYHLGRILTYTLIGLMFGILGLGFRFFGVQQQFSVITGLVMIVAVLFPRLMRRKGMLPPWYYRFVSAVKNRLGALMRKRSAKTFFLAGLFNGLLPCGMVYMAVLGAMTTDSLWEGGAYMAFFGLGTVPLMTVAVYLGNLLTPAVRHRVRKLVPVVVVGMGVLFIVRGLGLGIPYISPAPVAAEASFNIMCH
ncbi:sulfite exporter TauE/SafE family protein [Sinomicrobium soli]|nr:sulfite exporter TauE/SafE family protein [Sinomicrobium sp. N-1-3-6]